NAPSPRRRGGVFSACLFFTGPAAAGWARASCPDSGPAPAGLCSCAAAGFDSVGFADPAGSDRSAAAADGPGRPAARAHGEPGAVAARAAAAPAWHSARLGAGPRAAAGPGRYYLGYCPGCYPGCRGCCPGCCCPGVAAAVPAAATAGDDCVAPPDGPEAAAAGLGTAGPPLPEKEPDGCSAASATAAAGLAAAVRHGSVDPGARDAAPAGPAAAAAGAAGWPLAE